MVGGRTGYETGVEPFGAVAFHLWAWDSRERHVVRLHDGSGPGRFRGCEWVHSTGISTTFRPTGSPKTNKILG